MTTYKPTGSTIIVEIPDEIKSASGIVSMSATDEALAVAKGVVVAIGDGKVDGKVFECPVKIGDMVLFPHHGGDKITKKLRVLGFRHVLAIEEK